MWFYVSMRHTYALSCASINYGRYLFYLEDLEEVRKDTAVSSCYLPTGLLNSLYDNECNCSRKGLHRKTGRKEVTKAKKRFFSIQNGHNKSKHSKAKSLSAIVPHGLVFRT